MERLALEGSGGDHSSQPSNPKACPTLPKTRALQKISKGRQPKVRGAFGLELRVRAVLGLEDGRLGC